MHSELFLLQKLLTLAVFLGAFHGYGKLWSRVLRMPFIEDRWLRASLGIAAGMGVFIIGMQVIGIAGLLKKDFVRALLVLGLALTLLKPASTYTLTSATATGTLRQNWTRWHSAAAILLLISTLASTLHKSLLPPIHWDELMYQLPHVREWLSTKRITINEWLRYPYFPYNFNLLYAAIISITGEYDSNLIHALAGWLIALLIFRLAQNNHGPLAAVLATAIWTSAAKWFFGTSYIELGISLFIFTAAIYFMLWMQDEKNNSSLLIATAFFLGLAAGTKYQAVIYLPFFMITAIFRERRLRIWLKASLAFMAACIFWYLRNLILTGNPVDPLAGNVFGYYDWSAEDFTVQLLDLQRSRNFPPKEIWLALLPMAFPAVWRQKETRWMIFLSIYAVTIWYFTSHYDRYLVPQYPILALLAAIGILYAINACRTIKQIIKPTKNTSSLIAGKVIFGASFIFFIIFSIPATVKQLKKIPSSPEAHYIYINERAQNFALLQSLQIHYPNEKIYQFGLEGGLLYGPKKIYGDHFGPWRYRDYQYLSASDLNKKLKAEGFTILAANPPASERLEENHEFQKYFSQILEHNGSKAYLVLNPGE